MYSVTNPNNQEHPHKSKHSSFHDLHASRLTNSPEMLVNATIITVRITSHTEEETTTNTEEQETKQSAYNHLEGALTTEKEEVLSTLLRIF